jgi:tetratricopeptide (TPR) repeat protein
MKIRALLAILIGLSLPSLGQAPDQKEDALSVNPARDLFDLATLNYNDAKKGKDPQKVERDYRIAAKKFDQFLRTFPRDKKAIEAWYFLGMSYREIGEQKASRACFQSAATNWKEGNLWKPLPSSLPPTITKPRNGETQLNGFKSSLTQRKTKRLNSNHFIGVFSVFISSKTRLECFFL